MTHLNDEQLESALQDPATQAEHLEGCSECQRRLEELQAVRQRLQTAFASVQTPPSLSKRIEAALRDGPDSAMSAVKAVSRQPMALRFRRYSWHMAAAAALILAAVPLFVYFAQPSPAQAAQQELVNIHRHNLAGSHGFYSEDEPAKLAHYFKDQLGFEPAMPKLNQGMAIRGCCTARFNEKIVGSYVVDTPHGVVSIIVISDSPEAVGLSRQDGRDGKPIWTGHMTLCNMAAVRMGGLTYTAVSEIPQDSLIQLLGMLVP